MEGNERKKGITFLFFFEHRYTNEQGEKKQRVKKNDGT